MQTVKVRSVEIGVGMPKICVPVMGRDEEEILAAAKAVREGSADLVEWRADWFSAACLDGMAFGDKAACSGVASGEGKAARTEGAADVEKMVDVARKLREVFGDLPFLFTFRTEVEGGEWNLAREEYVRLNVAMARSGHVDLVDVELSAGEGAVGDVVHTAHENGVKVVASSHDFEKTPAREEIVGRLRQMQDLDADILKIAVMPKCRRDVLTLLAATEEMYTEHADRPLVTMSMGELGKVSRVCGETFGSAVTFGAVGNASAPGQMEAGRLRGGLELLHG